MPLITAHLFKLSPTVTASRYLRATSSSGVKPLVVSRVIRWIIKPEMLSKRRLLDTSWDLLLILGADSPFPNAYLGRDWIEDHWSITAGMPSRLYNGFEKSNDSLLNPAAGSVPALTGSMKDPKIATSTQGLELTDELRQWSSQFRLGQAGAVSMLNLLAFHPGDEAHESYQRYGKAFAQSIGSKRGGNAKIVGKIVPHPQTQDEDRDGWDEIALAHYPSINHFVDMLASEDYQEVNHQYRLPALRDTCILCTSELDPELQADRARL